MRRFKKVFAFGLVAVMTTTLLMGCSSKKETNSSETAQTNTNESAKTETKKEETKTENKSSDKKTVVTVWTKDRHDAEFQQAKVDEYNATNTDNIEVKYEIYSDNYVQAVDMAFQSGEAPDIFVFQATMFANYVNSGKYADITPYMDDEFKATFADNMIDGLNVIDGKCYYVPTAATTCRLFYNKNIFERVGIQNPPTSIEEMVEDAKLITSQLSGEGVYGFAANMKSASSALNRSLIQMGQRSLGVHVGYDFAKGEYDFNGYTDIVSAWRTLMSEECAFPGSESLDIDPLRTQFAAGKIGMYMSYTHAEPGVYENQFPMEDEWACAQIPTLTGSVVGAENYTANNGYLFNADSKNLDAAWKAYVAIFADVDNLADYYSEGLGISTVPAAIAKATPKDTYVNNPDLLIGKTDKIWPKTPHEENVDAVVVEGQDMYNTFAELILTDKDIASGLKDLTDRYNAAYRAGIAEGIGQEIKIANFDPMNP